MVSKKTKILTSIGFFTFLSAAPVQAANVALFDAHLMGGWTGASASRTSGGGATFSANQSMSYGLGAGVELPMGSMLGIVTGLDYVQRRFEIGYDAARVERIVPTVFVPLMLRGWLSNSFYLQGGVYASKGIGHVKDTFQVGSSSIFNFDSSSRRAVDYGAVAGLGANIAFYEKTGIYVQAQYLYGLSDSSSSSLYSEKVRDFLISTGVRIEI